MPVLDEQRGHAPGAEWSSKERAARATARVGLALGGREGERASGRIVEVEVEREPAAAARESCRATGQG